MGEDCKMKIEKHWQRFLKKYITDINPNFPKRFVGEFTKEGILFRVELILTNEYKIK